MDRRSFLKTSTAVAATAAGGATAAAEPFQRRLDPEAPPAAPALVPGRKELRLAMPWPDSVSGPADSAVRLAHRLETALDGRWHIEPRHHAHGGLEAVMSGDCDLYFGTENHSLSFHPAFAFFAALPGAGTFNADDLVSWLRIGGGQELWDELAGAFNVKPFLVGHLGRWPGLWTRHPITSLADLENQPVAVQGLARDVMRGIGAVPVHVPVAGLAQALASGEVSAVEYGGALSSLELGLHRAAGHLNGFGILEGGIALSLGIRRSLWDRLGTSERVVVSAMAAEEAQLSIAEMRAHEKPIRALLRNAHGVAFAPLPSDVAIAIDRVSEAVVAVAGSADDMARRINRSYHAFRNAAWGVDGPVDRSATT